MAIGWRCDGARHVQTLLALGPIGDLSDGQLLERFALRDGERSEMAFAALVDRHGPMVLRTCRAVLRDAHDAHDAFQATFLVLARRAGSLWVGDSLAAWLHQVARRTALCARSASARRRKHETQAAALTPSISPDAPPDDLGEVLHAEIARLPVRYREAVVLCLLEGLAQDQAAHRLGCPVGTLQSRLARARERLRARLTRRGLSPTVAPAGAMVPASTVDSTARAATGFAAGHKTAGIVSASVLSLVQEVRSAMFFAKWKLIGVAVLGAGLVASGAGVLARQAGDSPSKPAEATSPEVGPGKLSPGDRVTILIERAKPAEDGSVKERIVLDSDERGFARVITEPLDANEQRIHPVSRINARSVDVRIRAGEAGNPLGSVNVEIYDADPATSIRKLPDGRLILPAKARSITGSVPASVLQATASMAARDDGMGMMGGMEPAKVVGLSSEMKGGMMPAKAKGMMSRTDPDVDRRLTEMERKLNLILDKMDGPKAEAK